MAEGIRQIFEIIGKFDTVIKSVEAAQTNFGSVHHADVKLPSLPETPLNAPK